MNNREKEYVRAACFVGAFVIAAVVDAFELLPAKWELILDVHGGTGVVGALIVGNSGCAGWASGSPSDCPAGACAAAVDDTTGAPSVGPRRSFQLWSPWLRLISLSPCSSIRATSSLIFSRSNACSSAIVECSATGREVSEIPKVVVGYVY